MIKVLKSVSHNNLHQKEVFHQVTKCGDIYINDDSTDAFLLCSFCASSSEDQFLRTVEEFIDHIKWHRSEDDPTSTFESVLSEIDQEIPTPPEGDPIDVKADVNPENTSHMSVEITLSQISDNCLLQIIDLFKKCPCLWHSTTAEKEKQLIDPAKNMITNFFNKLTKRTESMEFVAELLEKIKCRFLEKCIDENDTSNKYFKTLNFLLTSEMAKFDTYIYTDYRCTICDQKLESFEFLWDHLCECHMEMEDNELSSIGFNDDGGSEYSDGANESQQSNSELLIEFIEAYKNQPRLWDRNHLNYTNRKLRKESYKVLGAVMEKHNESGTQRSVLAKIKCLRTQFAYTRRKIEECKQHDFAYIPHIWYYDKLSFLKDTVREKTKPSSKTAQIGSPQDTKKRVNKNTFMSSTCIACNKKFPNLTACLDHMQCSHDNKAFQSPDGFFYCPICNYQNKTKYSLIRHLRHSHSTNFKVCDDCGTKFRFMSALAKHKAKVHNDFRPFKCSQCGKGFANLCRMQLHSVTHWDADDRPHVCEICGSKFSNRANLTVHIRRHTRDFKLACEICDHKAATTTELRSHMLKHTKDYPFICDICGKGFRSKRLLTLHQNEIHGDETFPCNICGKELKSKKKLQYHYEVHKPIADQECEVCGMKFFRVGSMRKHMRRKHKKSVEQILLLDITKDDFSDSIEQMEDV